ISEGSGRRGARELRQFLNISMASLSELETLLIIASRIGYLNSSDYSGLHDRVKRITAQLSGLINAIERKISSQ
ncbi:MAG: four helix bundle protein, partial [Bacteroidales bacterium]|nr:four helix bundle protein [Bacteroidales bacterium]